MSDYCVILPNYSWIKDYLPSSSEFFEHFWNLCFNSKLVEYVEVELFSSISCNSVEFYNSHLVEYDLPWNLGLCNAVYYDNDSRFYLHEKTGRFVISLKNLEKFKFYLIENEIEHKIENWDYIPYNSEYILNNNPIKKVIRIEY